MAPRTHSVHDYLEAIYFLATPVGEYGPLVKGEAPVPAARVAEMLQVTPPTASEMLKRLEADGLVERGPRKGPVLTKRGREEAERIVRNHRIIERFLTDFMGYTPAESHVHADEMGDAFTDEMVERLSVQLGHPDRCPHGWPVDTTQEKEENADLRPLSQVASGPARIVRLAEHDGDLLHWFYEQELVPGTELEVTRVDEAAGQLTLTVGGEERVIGERAAAGLYVLPG
ncbi:metal-dependent transcriptional regulator [Miltoncostaea marina]|uniref:metal-dependent transcriptional regulator n=1 Tax=Miltoncostaea marina TaxID=2843215 RepID=UPI001C3D88D4|nr:metal-dependent transcriptional regulator [Miltoncostaea marina]